MSSNKKYTSTAEILDYWIGNIAPNYFDFSTENNYRSGTFGYINEVMSDIVMDTHNGINIARREFYPVSAQNPQSIYKMAALQKLGLPMATPSTCNAVLLLDQTEVIQNSTNRNGSLSCFIDSSCTIMVGNIPFALLYPIEIISSNKNGTWNHTIHYDKSTSNSLDSNEDTSSNYYITNKCLNQNGKKYLLLSVTLYQVSKQTLSNLVTTDGLIQTVSMIFNFEGDLANFEVFYLEEPDSSEPVQLIKLMQGQSIIEKPFCYYRLLDSNMLEISFPKNIYFTPQLNSEIRLDVYTSYGKSGNFKSFNGTIACSMESEKYPYNNNMTMLGVINGSALGGQDVPSFEKYNSQVQTAYATNSTLTTTHDLQIKFNNLSNDENNRVIFRKKRADAFERSYGAYTLLKDSEGNVVPTNTLSVKMTLAEFDSYNEMTNKAIIKPGTLFEYDPETINNDIPTAMKVTDLTISDDLSQYDFDTSRFLFANPFLIVATLYPNLIGYYNNSVNENHSVEYSYINDSSALQFIGSNLKIYRNSISRENFYKVSLNISPTNDLDVNTIIIQPEIDDDDYYIRATENGKVTSVTYNGDSVICEVMYESGTTDTIKVGNSISKNGDEYEYNTGYELKVNVYNTFTKGDILAVKKVTDLGKIRACINLKSILYDNNLYCPMTIEDYNKETNAYTLVGYLSTDDIMDNNGTILIDHGIYNLDGSENENVSIPYSDLSIEVAVFYKNDEINLTHKYASFDYLQSHTLTNIYSDSVANGISLIEPIDFIRSVLTFTEPEKSTNESPSEEDEFSDVTPGIDEEGAITGDYEEDDIYTGDLSESQIAEVNADDNILRNSDDYDQDEFIIHITEIPFAKANWIKDQDNFSYLLEAITGNFDKCQQLYYDLENNYGIDMKFYNTYGKSRFFRTGIRKTWSPLASVNCSFRFGISLQSLVQQDDFLAKFRAYVKEYIESINSIDGSQSIYIMNLISSITANFSDIGYIEYYGFDNYDNSAQKIELIPSKEMSDELITNYIPEFINICSYKENGKIVSNIQVDFLNQEE